MKKVHALLVAVGVALAGPALADKGGKDKGHKGKDHSAAEHAPGHGGKEHGPPTFSSGERGEIERYYASNLPPGLAKKGKVPPGWAKKLERGKPVPADLWELRVPLPRDILVKLPPPPPGVVLVRIHDHVLKVRERTHEVLDKIGLPHP